MDAWHYAPIKKQPENPQTPVEIYSSQKRRIHTAPNTKSVPGNATPNNAPRCGTANTRRLKGPARPEIMS